MPGRKPEMNIRSPEPVQPYFVVLSKKWWLKLAVDGGREDELLRLNSQLYKCQGCIKEVQCG